MSRTTKWIVLAGTAAAGLIVGTRWIADGRALDAEYRRLVRDGRRVEGRIVRYERVVRPMLRSGTGWRHQRSNEPLPVERAAVMIDFRGGDVTERVSETWLAPFDESLREGSVVEGFWLPSNRRVKAASAQDPFLRRARFVMSQDAR